MEFFSYVFSDVSFDDDDGSAGKDTGKRADDRLQPVHKIMDEAHEIRKFIPAIDESLRGRKGNYIKVRNATEKERGKTGKYPKVLEFSLYDRTLDGENGAHGELFYLSDGRPGKLVVNTWKDHSHYKIQAKDIKGELVLTYIDHNLMPETKKTRVYDYRNE